MASAMPFFLHWAGAHVDSDLYEVRYPPWGSLAARQAFSSSQTPAIQQHCAHIIKDLIIIGLKTAQICSRASC